MNKLASLTASVLVKVGNHYDGNVSPNGYYKPTKPNKKTK